MIHDFEKWQRKWAEYYRCGGDQLSDKTMILAALDMLASGTECSVRMAIQTARIYEDFKVTLHKTITYFEDRGALGRVFA